MVKYGRDVFREFNLTTYTDKTTLVNVTRKVKRIQSTIHGTSTPDAIEECVAIYKVQGCMGVPRIIMVVTDGVTAYRGNTKQQDKERLKQATAMTVKANTINYAIAFSSHMMQVHVHVIKVLQIITGNNTEHYFLSPTLNRLKSLTSNKTSTIGCCEPRINRLAMYCVGSCGWYTNGR